MSWSFDSVSPTGALFCPSLQRLCLWVEGGDVKPAVVGVEWTVLTTVGTLVSQTGLQRPSVLCHLSDGTLGPD